MPTNLKFINPDALTKPPGYTQVVEISGPGRMVYVAGQLGLKADGTMAGSDFAAQCDQAFENLKAALAAVGGRLDHIVKITNFIVDMKNLPAYRAARDRNFVGQSPPASTTIAVPALARPDALFEIEAVAVLPPR